ncbi:MAG TPA: hypothetical protein VF292_15690 [Rhodanobacteraceae bacterium]
MPVSTTLLAITLPVLVAVAACGVIAWLLLRQARHQRTLRTLYLDADALEHDLKACRARLQRAHAAMSLGPNRPATGEADAERAVEAALRELLAHRLWLRDQAGTANQRDLDAAVHAIDQARGALGIQLQALDSAQRALETAVRAGVAGLTQR